MSHLKHLLPVGKLPPEILARLLSQAPVVHDRLLLGPGVGLDCAVVEFGLSLLVLKSDPITFATEEIGWYAVQVNANDIATTGAIPRWLLITLLLPEGSTTAQLVDQISQQVFSACREICVTLVGGHTEITVGLDRPIIMGTLIGEVDRQDLITPRGANPSDRILLTKGVPIEATAILAREFPHRLRQALSQEEIYQARAFLRDPGISVLREARLAVQAGRVTAMHDPTEGGLASALWELAEASDRTLIVDLAVVPIPDLSARICQLFGLDPFATIASGALLLTVASPDASPIKRALKSAGIPCAEIGEVQAGPAEVWHRVQSGLEKLPRPIRDEITRVFET